MGKVYLTGAGPGDIDLLTVKALRIIKIADVILYDRLINPKILEEAKNGCKFIYVGKEDGKHILPQDEINEVLYQNAMRSDIVVRLKGGDPLVFGRGGEEGLYLGERGIEYEIIPGITSAISVPAYAGIPVTHRGIAVSFTVITGHESPNKKNSQINWSALRDIDTIIFLMGLHNLDKIVSQMIQIGKPKDYPIALISKGTTKDQQVVISTLEKVTKETINLPTPALIIMGNVVNLRKNLDWFQIPKN